MVQILDLQGIHLPLEGLPFSLKHPTSFIPCQPAECRIEAFTHRRKRIRRHLLRRKVAIEFASLNDAKITKELVFLARPKIIRILETNGKGLNASIRRIQDNDSLEGKQQLKPDEDYKVIDDLQHWSQRGIAKLAEDMTINHKKQRRSSRQAWTETAFEEIEDAIEKQREYLESSESRIRKAIDKAKRLADNKLMCI